MSEEEVKPQGLVYLMHYPRRCMTRVRMSLWIAAEVSRNRVQERQVHLCQTHTQLHSHTAMLPSSHGELDGCGHRIRLVPTDEPCNAAGDRIRVGE